MNSNIFVSITSFFCCLCSEVLQYFKIENEYLLRKEEKEKRIVITSDETRMSHI